MLRTRKNTNQYKFIEARVLRKRLHTMQRIIVECYIQQSVAQICVNKENDKNAGKDRIKEFGIKRRHTHRSVTLIYSQIISFYAFYCFLTRIYYFLKICSEWFYL